MKRFQLDPMQKKYLVSICVAGLLLSGLGFFLASRPLNNQQTGVNDGRVATPVDQVSIDKGCDTGSGYIWCEPKQKCLRLYEEKCEGVVPATDSASPTSTNAATPSTTSEY